MNTLSESVDMLGFLFVDEDAFTVDPDAAAKVLTGDAGAVLEASAKALADVEWTTEAIEAALRASLIDGLGLKPKNAFGPVRVAISGRRISPPLFESLELLGREKSLHRLERGPPYGVMAAMERADAGPPYQRLLRNPDAPRGFVVIGAFTILVGWMIASLIILGVQQSHPEGSRRHGLVVRAAGDEPVADRPDPAEHAGRAEAEPADPGAVVLGGRAAALAGAGVVRGWSPWRSSW